MIYFQTSEKSFEMNIMPPELLEMIFDYLDASTILSVTETCTEFNAIVSNSERLTRKLTIYLKYPMGLNNFAESLIGSTRKYRRLNIVKSRDRVYETNSGLTNRLLRKLGKVINYLTVDWNYCLRPREASLLEVMNRRRLSRVFPAAHIADPLEIAAQTLGNIREDINNEFYQIVRFFTNVKEVSFFNVHLERERYSNEPEVHYPNLKYLKLHHCDAFCFNFLKSCNHLVSLDVTDGYWNARNPGIENFEQFLINQRELKVLHLKNFQYPRLFQVDPTANIVFKLETLILKSVYFADKDIANNFFKAQTELKIIDFELRNEKVRSLDDMLWYNNILKTVITRNKSLHTVKVSKQRYKIANYDFLANIKNHHVRNLKFSVSSEDKSAELFKVFIRMFPNLRSVDFNAEEGEDTDCGICFDEGTFLEKVETLVITNSSVRSLVNVHAGSLIKFEYQPGKTGEFIDDLFGGFFHRHRNIKHLVIGSPFERSYFFVSYNLCQLIVNFLNQIESITIYNFGEVNKSVKLLCNLRKLKTLTLSTEDFQQFTAKTKVECTRNDLKLVHIDIPNHESIV